MSDLGGTKSVSISVLGPIEITRDSIPIELGASRLKTLLVLLCIRQGRPVAAERLIDELWEEDPPAGAKATLQSYVSNLRRELGSDVILTSGSGYGLGPEVDLDLTEFEECIGTTRGAPSTGVVAEHSRRSLERACEIWRGSFAEDIRPLDRLERYAKVVDEQRLMATALRLEALIKSSPEQSISELRVLRSEYPTDEKFLGLTMRALVNLDRRAEALRECHEFRLELIERTGMGPSAAIRTLEASIASEDIQPVVSQTSKDAEALVFSPPGNSFVGRRDLFDLVCETSQNRRLVTLVGPGGAGKSRLAAEVVHYLRSSFNKVLVNDLSEEADIESAVSRVGRIGDEIPPGDESTRNLVLLENCERAASEISGEIDTLLRERSDIQLIATSRIRLNVSAERVVSVPPLSTQPVGSQPLSPASQLLADRMESLGEFVDQKDWPLLEEISLAVDGLPFVLELAAERAAGLGLRPFVSQIHSQLSVLSSERFEATHRHRSVESMMAWTLDYLEPEHLRFVTALTIFEAPFTLDAAEAIGNVVGVDVSSSLAKLIDQSTVLKVPDSNVGQRYVVLETLRTLLADEFLKHNCRNDIERAFVEYFAARASDVASEIRAMSGAQRALTISPDQPNLQASLRLAQRHGLFREVVDLLWTFIWHCHELDDVAEVGRWVRDVLADEPPHTVCATTVARAHVGVVAIGFFLTSPDVTNAEAAEAVTVARTVDDPGLLADALSLQGATAIIENDLACAFAALTEAKELCRSIGHIWGLATVDLFRATAERRAHRFELSYQVGRKALERLVYLDDKRGISLATQSIARTLHEMGQVADAASLASESYEVAAEIQDHVALAMAALAYGRTATSVEDLDFGRSLFVEALLASIKTQNKILLSNSLEWIAFVDYFRSGNEGVLAFVDGFTSQYRNGVTRPSHEAVLKKAHKSLGPELFDIERRQGRNASLGVVLGRLGVSL